MKCYFVYYRKKRTKTPIYETCVTAANMKEAYRLVRCTLDSKFTIIKVRREI